MLNQKKISQQEMPNCRQNYSTCSIQPDILHVLCYVRKDDWKHNLFFIFIFYEWSLINYVLPLHKSLKFNNCNGWQKPKLSWLRCPLHFKISWAQKKAVLSTKGNKISEECGWCCWHWPIKLVSRSCTERTVSKFNNSQRHQHIQCLETRTVYGL